MGQGQGYPRVKGRLRRNSISCGDPDRIRTDDLWLDRNEGKNLPNSVNSDTKPWVCFLLFSIWPEIGFLCVHATNLLMKHPVAFFRQTGCQYAKILLHRPPFKGEVKGRGVHAPPTLLLLRRC